MIPKLFQMMKSSGSTEMNIMRNPSFPKTITYSGLSDYTKLNDNGCYVWGSDGVYFKDMTVVSPSSYYSLVDSNINNSPPSPTYWQYDAGITSGASLQQSEGGSSNSLYSEYKVSFATGINVSAIGAYSCYAFGRSEMGASHGGYVQLSVNGSLIWSLGETRAHANFYSATGWTGVTEIKLACYGWQSGGITPAGGYTCMGELAVWSRL